MKYTRKRKISIMLLIIAIIIVYLFAIIKIEKSQEKAETTLHKDETKLIHQIIRLCL